MYVSYAVFHDPVGRSSERILKEEKTSKYGNSLVHHVVLQVREEEGVMGFITLRSMHSGNHPAQDRVRRTVCFQTV